MKRPTRSKLDDRRREAANDSHKGWTQAAIARFLVEVTRCIWQRCNLIGRRHPNPLTHMVNRPSLEEHRQAFAHPCDVDMTLLLRCYDGAMTLLYQKAVYAQHQMVLMIHAYLIAASGIALFLASYDSHWVGLRLPLTTRHKCCRSRGIQCWRTFTDRAAVF